MSKNDEIWIQNEELCIKNVEFCIKNDEFCSILAMHMALAWSTLDVWTVTLAVRFIPQDDGFVLKVLIYYADKIVMMKRCA